MTIKDYIDNIVIKEKKIPYFDVLVTKGGKEVFRYFNNATNTATGKEKLYMYSCSKVITAVSTMLLVERGIISLEDEVSKYLPCFNDVFLIENGVKVKPQKAITIKHLLTMSAGHDYLFEEKPAVMEEFEKNPNATVIDIVKQLVKYPLNFEPGTKFKYSLCHDVLGAVIEVASGVKFSDFVEQNIFSPLEMKNSTFKFDDNGFEPLFLANDGKIIPFPPPEAKWANDKTYESGGGGLKSTVEDYSKFLTALAAGKIISFDTINLMTTDTCMAFEIKNSFTCIQGKDYGYGLGVRVRKVSTNFGLPVGEFGWDGAAGSYGLVDLKNGVTVTIGMHVRNWPNVFNEHLKIVEMIYKTIL